jgi:hypothetical protein
MTSDGYDSGVFLRHLGSMERMYQLFTTAHSMHFSVVAELDRALEPERLQAALGEVARKHPLLTATVHVGAPGHAVFRSQDATIPIRVEEDMPWERVVEAELATPLPAVGPGSSSRVALIRGVDGATLVLTFAHHVADGSSAVRVLNDLIAAVNGARFGAGDVPEPREVLFTGVPDVQEVIDQGPPAGPPPVVDERMRIAPTYLPAMLPPSRPSVAGASIGANTVSALRRRAKDEQTTVHGALLAATTLEIAEQRGLDFVRIMSPISLVRVIGSQSGTGVFINAARSAATPATAGGFWDLAREHIRQLAPGRSATGIGRAAAAFIANTGTNATPESAAGFMGRGALGLDALVTNLGPVTTASDGPVTVRRFWGPVVLMQVDGETGISAATHGGDLQLTEVTRDADIRVIVGVTDRLRAATR